VESESVSDANLPSCQPEFAGECGCGVAGADDQFMASQMQERGETAQSNSPVNANPR
jgi:hypothetical protein